MYAALSDYVYLAGCGTFGVFILLETLRVECFECSLVAGEGGWEAFKQRRQTERGMDGWMDS